MTESSVYSKWAAAESRRKIKLQAVTYLGGACTKCGYAKCVAALEFHHRDHSQKDFQISGGSRRRWSELKEELDKCDLLCANCHREVHEEIRAEKLVEQRRQARLSSKEIHPALEAHCTVCAKPYKLLACLIGQRFTCSPRCGAKRREKIVWPSDEALSRLVWEHPLTQLSARFGVSDRAIQKRCRLRKINTPKKGYWSNPGRVQEGSIPSPGAEVT